MFEKLLSKFKKNDKISKKVNAAEEAVRKESKRRYTSFS